jgi:hypothetical protein
MTQFFGYLGLVLGAVTVILGVVCNVVANRFFGQLIAVHPDLKDSLPKGPAILVGQRGGPLRTSYMKYLNERRYKNLAEPELRAMGHRSWSLVVLYAVVFVALVICLLLWSYFRSNGI